MSGRGGSIVSPETRARVRDIAVPVAVSFGRLGLTPNHLTLIGFGIAILAALAAAAQLWLVAGLLVVGGGVFDLFDGALARATGKVSRLGAFLDSVFDRSSEGVVYIGVIAGSQAAELDVATVLAAAAMTSAFMVSYSRAKSESLGFTAGTGMANVGLAPREVRVAILTLGLVLAGLVTDVGLALGATLGLITLLATLTTGQRIVHVIRQSRTQEHG